jgi:hypothetical protein
MKQHKTYNWLMILIDRFEYSYTCGKATLRYQVGIIMD